MKKISLSVVIIVLVSLLFIIGMSKDVISAKQTNEKCSSEVDDFKLCIVSDKLFAEIGKEITITAFVRNTGDEEVIISNHTPFYIKVFNEEGERVPTISEIKAKEEINAIGGNPWGFLEKVSISHRYGVTLKPQKKWMKVIKVGKEYDLNKKGKYFVEIRSKLPNKQQNGYFDLTLDKIEINIK